MSFSKTGSSVHYKAQTITRIKGGGIAGNYFELESGKAFLDFKHQKK